MRKKIATLVAVLKEVEVLYDNMFSSVIFYVNKECDYGRILDIKKFLLYYDCDYDREICKTVRILLQKDIIFFFYVSNMFFLLFNASVYFTLCWSKFFSIIFLM